MGNNSAKFGKCTLKHLISMKLTRFFQICPLWPWLWPLKSIGFQWLGRDFCQWAIFSFFRWFWNFQWAIYLLSTQTLMGHFSNEWDYGAWPLAFPITGVHHFIMGNMSAKFDENAQYGLDSIMILSWTSGHTHTHWRNFIIFPRQHVGCTG